MISLTAVSDVIQFCCAVGDGCRWPACTESAMAAAAQLAFRYGVIFEADPRAWNLRGTSG